MILLSGISVVFGQTGTGTISGIVKDSAGANLAHANITVLETNQGAFSDVDGRFRIENVNQGRKKLRIQLFTYLPTDVEVDVVEGETTELPEIRLKQNVSEVKEVVLSTERNRYKINTPSSSLRIQTPLLEVPQNIQVVTNEVLKDQQVISMSDGLIRNVSGLVKVEHWGDLYTNISVRGSQIQAFRNGFNVVNSNWGPLTEDMSFVDNIEFVKGPAGFMLSSGDPSGLYNVVTKKPTGISKGDVSVTAGSFNLYRTTLDLDGKISNNGKLLYRLNLAAQNKGSHRPNEFNNRYAIAPVISYQIDEKTKVTAEYNYQRADMSDVGSFYVFSPEGFGTLPRDFSTLPAGLPASKINDHSFYVNLQHDFSKSWKVTAQLARFYYDQEGSSLWPNSVNANGTMIRQVGIWDAQSRMGMAQLFVNGNVKTGPVSHKILAGLDMATKNYIADWSQTHALDTAGAEFDPKNPDLGVPVNGYPQFDRSTPLAQRAQLGGGLLDQSYMSVYLQDELGFFNNKLRLTLAGRYTDLKQSSYGAKPDAAYHFTPRIGLSVSVTEQTALYALYDQAFIPQSGVLSNGNKVQPVTGNNFEVGAKRDWFGSKWNTTLAVFRILKNNELTADPTAGPLSGLSVELGQKRAQGIEFDLRGTVAKGVNLIANYAYTDSRVVKVAEGVTTMKVGDLVPGFSKHTINTWLTYKQQNGLFKGTGVSLGSTFLMDRATYWSPAPDPEKEIEDYFKVDAGLFWENNKIRVSANVFNVMDAYLYSGSYYSYLNAYDWQTEPGRNFRVAINYNF